MENDDAVDCGGITTVVIWHMRLPDWRHQRVHHVIGLLETKASGATEGGLTTGRGSEEAVRRSAAEVGPRGDGCWPHRRTDGTAASGYQPVALDGDERT